MFLAKAHNVFIVVQKNGVIASSFSNLSDIYNAGYRATKHKFESGEVIIKDDNFTIGSFKDLKHRVSAYILMNEIDEPVPYAYKEAFARNGHNYDKVAKNGSMSK